MGNLFTTDMLILIPDILFDGKVVFEKHMKRSPFKLHWPFIAFASFAVLQP